MKPMIYATVATITLVTANFAFAGNCATHSAEAVKCDLAGINLKKASLDHFPIRTDQQFLASLRLFLQSRNLLS